MKLQIFHTEARDLERKLQICDRITKFSPPKVEFEVRMGIVDKPAFRIFRGQRKYDDQQPLNKNTPNLGFHRPIDDPAPYIVVVQGPHNVGKSLLIESLVLNWSHMGGCILEVGQRHCTILLTTASGKEIRLQFVECPNDINGMIDAAKYADVAILMIDASYGFEMETFEFRNLLQVHGFPKVIGVFTHLDKIGVVELSEAKQRLEDHFCTEICEGAKLSFLSGLEDGLYKQSEMDDLKEMLSDAQILPLSWRVKHPYMLVDNFEYDTRIVRGDKQSSRILSLHGYLRGCKIENGTKVHIAGAGDFSLAGVEQCCGSGTHTRLDVLDVPPEIVENFDLHHPILVGGILPEEENSGYMQVKLRRHSWYYELLMTGAPITVSAGWRRYQTTAVYAMENQNGQHLLDYTPEHKDCLAFFWGPLAAPKTRIVAVLSGSQRKKAFRITAKGVVLDFDHDARILQKAEEIGIPVQIWGKTASIKFAPELKIDRFVGATVQTKRGIQGKIYKAEGEGYVRCEFKDNIDFDDTFLFPVLTPAKLPLLFKHLEMSAAAGKEVAPRQRQMLDQRRGVAIHEGKSDVVSFPNLLELSYLSRKLTENKMAMAQEEIARKSKKEGIKKRERRVEKARKIIQKLAKEEQISGEVKEERSLDRSGEEAKVNDADALLSYVHGKATVCCYGGWEYPSLVKLETL